MMPRAWSPRNWFSAVSKALLAAKQFQEEQNFSINHAEKQLTTIAQKFVITEKKIEGSGSEFERFNRYVSELKSQLDECNQQLSKAKE